MDIAELRAFIAIADSGSIKSAALTLDCPRATIRRRLKALEARIGAPLVLRAPEGARLTLVGTRVLSRARALLRDADKFLTAAAPLDRLPVLRARMPVGLPPRLIAQVFRAVRGLLPETRVEVTGDASRPVDIVASLGDPGMPEWHCHTLMQVRVRLVASPRYLARRGTPTTVGALRDHTLLTWRPSDRQPDEWPLLDGSLTAVTPALIHDDIHQVRHIAAAGLGIALLPDAEVDLLEFEGEPLSVLLDDVVGETLPLTLAIHPAVADYPAFAAAATLLAQLADQI